MGRCARTFLVLLLFSGAASPVLAGRLPVRRFTVADGLPSDRINCLLADTRGYLWIGTGDGLSRYDGYRFVNYDERDGLPGPIIRNILETRDGIYFAGTVAAVCRLSSRVAQGPRDTSAKRFECVELRIPLGPIGVNVLYEGRDGRLWIGSDLGLYRLDRSSVRAERFDTAPVLDFAPTPSPMVLAIAEDREGGLWLGTDAGLVHRPPSGRTETFQLTSGPLTSGKELASVDDLRVDRAGRLWATGRQRLFRLDLPLPALTAQSNQVLEDLARDPHSGVRSYPNAESLAGFYANLLEDSTGSIRLLNGDLCRVDEANLICTPRAQILQEGILRHFAEDRSGALWLGTESSGLLRLSPSGLSSFGTEDGLRNLRVRSIFETPGGDLHVLAETDLARWTGDRFNVIRPNVPRRIRNMGWGWNQVYLEDHLGEWWIATGEGVVRFPRVSRTEDLAGATPLHVYTAADGLSRDEVFRLYEDRNGDIWIALTGGAVNLYRWERSRDHLHEVPLPERFGKDIATAFAEDRAGNLWIGFNVGGLARRRHGEFDLFPPGGSIPEGIIRDFLVDGAGRLWAATTGGGAIVVENPTEARPSFSSYTAQRGLSSNRIFCVTDDQQGRIYFGTTRGVDRLDPATGRVRRYTVGDGLPSSEVQIAHRDRRGDLWFGSATGLARLSPRQDPPEGEAPVLIDLFRVDGVPRRVAELGEREVGDMKIAPGSRQIEIGFVGLSLPAAEGLRYQHRLLGGTDDWNPPSADRSVSFSNLPPGRYRFEVRAVTPGGVSTSQPAAATFRVLPPFWRTWWFMLTGAAAIVCSASLLHRWRTARLVELERIRTRIATDLHDEVGAGLSEIALMGELWAGRGTGGSATDEAPRRIAAKSRRLVDAMSDIVWAINPEKDRLFSLSQRMRRFATPFLRSAGVALTFQSIDESHDRALDGNARREVLLAFQEIVNNAARHASCSKVEVRLEVRDHHLSMKVVDDGRGFDPAKGSDGTGLSSLKQRAARLGGTCEIEAAPDRGTRVTFRIPLDGRRRRPGALPDRGGASERG